MIIDTLLLHVHMYYSLFILGVGVEGPSDLTHQLFFRRLTIGQEIAQMLQGGYRMPKPQHVGQRL